MGLLQPELEPRTGQSLTCKTFRVNFATSHVSAPAALTALETLSALSNISEKIWQNPIVGKIAESADAGGAWS